MATMGEGIALRRAGITTPILVFGALDSDEMRAALAAELSITLSTVEALDSAARAVRMVRVARATRPPGIHLKLDTGMTRMGILPKDVPAALNRLRTLGIPLEGLYTHLACADDPDPTFTQEQTKRFRSVVTKVRRRFPQVIVHMANSGGTLVHPDTCFDMVRVGLAVYGLYPAPHLRGRATLVPAMALKSRVIRIVRAAPGTVVSYGATYRVRSRTTIATVACGYADGYPRLASNRGEVVIRSRRLPVAGRVCMDYLMVDAGDHPVAVGDEAILFGEGISADEVAEWAQTITYEIVCGVGPRVPRVYLSGQTSRGLGRVVRPG